MSNRSSITSSEAAERAKREEQARLDAAEAERQRLAQFQLMDPEEREALALLEEAEGAGM